MKTENTIASETEPYPNQCIVDAGAHCVIVASHCWQANLCLW